MSNAATWFSPLRFTFAAALIATTLAGCSSDSRVAAEPASPQVSAQALGSRPSDPNGPRPAPAPVGETPSADAASELHSSASALGDAGRALEQLATRAEASSRLVQGSLSTRLAAQAGALRAEIRALGTIDEQLERAARALKRMHLAQLHAARIEHQIREAAEKLSSPGTDPSTSPETLAQLREQLASLQRSLDAHLASSEVARADALHADQLALEAAAQVRKQYTALAERTLELVAAAQRAGGSARALTPVAGQIDGLLGSFASTDRDIGSLLQALLVAIQGPMGYWQDWIAQTLPDLTQFEGGIEQYFPQPPDDRGSLRVLTYNTAFLSIVIEMSPLPDITLDLNDGVFSGLNYEDRAHKIAEGILRGDQDVVVLNEVFSDDARDVLIDELSVKGPYKHYVAKLAGEPILAGKTLAQLLAEAYLPSFVVDLVKLLQIPGIDEYMVHPGDSGLMIFSRYKFLPLNGVNDADCIDAACDFAGWNNGGPLLPDEVVFDIYDNCSDLSSDCLASKGVGLVKLDTPGDPSYVAFTHMQADDAVLEGEAPKRELQYDEVEALLTANISDQNLFERRVFFVGDLNTPGHNRANLQPAEWLDVYHPSNNGSTCYACGNGGGTCKYAQNGDLFTDPWGFETSVLDDGLTQLNDHERLDYLLHNAAGGRACMQYIHKAYDVAENGSHWYSDHLPVRADFNASGAACSANDEAPMSLNRPRDLVFTSTNCDFDPNTQAPPCQQTLSFVAPQAKLAHAGSFQWYRITQAGSYSIKLDDAPPDKRADFEVYQAADMSRPIKPFSEEEHPRWGKPYAMLEPPYYVRVFAVDANGKPDRGPSSAGREYRIDFHQHLCRDPEDGCFLDSAIKYPYIWPEVTNLSNVNQLYFKFKTSGVANGHLTPKPAHYPMVRFQEESILGSNLDCLDPLELHEYQGLMPPVFVKAHAFQSVETDDDQNWDDVDGPDRRSIAPDLDGEQQDAFKYYYVKMSRKMKPECDMPFPTNLRFETDLTYFRAGRTRCYKQYDDSGAGEDDHTRFHLFFDEPFVFSWTFCDTQFCHEAVFDEPAGDNWLADEPSLQGYFVKELTLGMWENDNGDDLLFNSHLQPIAPTPPWLRREDGLGLFITDNPDPVDADYSYRVEYILCREQDNCQLKM